MDGHYIEEDAHAMCFKNIMDEFYSYEKENGKFINISKDFKSKLFETFMKNSDDKSDMGQFFTPLKIVREMVNMVTISNGMKICDPASGVGKFLLEAAANVPFEMKNGQINSGVELYGFEKQMSGKDDITTILAKANMLIYFSKLFKDNYLPILHIIKILLFPNWQQQPDIIRQKVMESRHYFWNGLSALLSMVERPTLFFLMEFSPI